MNLSKLPLRHTDYAGRLALLEQSNLFIGDAVTGFRLSGVNSLHELGAQLEESIENFIGFMPVPVGLATNFKIDGVERLIPLATEERGIIAGCSKAAKLCHPEGFLTAVADSGMSFQILFSGFDSEQQKFEAMAKLKQEGWDAIAKIVGPLAIGNPRITSLPQNQSKSVTVSLTLLTKERMGAGLVTKLAEQCSKELGRLIDRPSTAAINTNCLAGRMAYVQTKWPLGVIGAETARRIVHMQDWAKTDDMRLATHIKGCLNAVLALGLATGQDVPAMAVTIMSRKIGSNRPKILTEYSIHDDALHGSLSLDLSIGVEGGATERPFAKMFRALAQIENGRDLGAAMAAAGLAANFGALHCLVTDGISAAHPRTATS